jgi:hypothetical protein
VRIASLLDRMITVTSGFLLVMVAHIALTGGAARAKPASDTCSAALKNCQAKANNCSGCAAGGQVGTCSAPGTACTAGVGCGGKVGGVACTCNPFAC